MSLDMTSENQCQGTTTRGLSNEIKFCIDASRSNLSSITGADFQRH